MRDRMKAKQNELSRRKLNDEIVKKLINLENGRWLSFFLFSAFIHLLKSHVLNILTVKI